MNNGTAQRNIEEREVNIKALIELLNFAKNIGDEDGCIAVYKSIVERRTELEEYLIAYNNTQKRLEFIARVDNISTSLSNTLLSISNLLEGGNDAVVNNSSTSDNMTGMKSSGNKKGVMSMSDQVNYNKLRDVYNDWGYKLMQMKNSNGAYSSGYNLEDKRKAQSEMRRIRKTAQIKYGKEIPYNSIEDWN